MKTGELLELLLYELAPTLVQPMFVVTQTTCLIVYITLEATDPSLRTLACCESLDSTTSTWTPWPRPPMRKSARQSKPFYNSVLYNYHAWVAFKDSRFGTICMVGRLAGLVLDSSYFIDAALLLLSHHPASFHPTFNVIGIVEKPGSP
jgi:hypothetical protein